MSRSKSRYRRRCARARAEYERVEAEIKVCQDRAVQASTAEDRNAAQEELVLLLKRIADSSSVRLWEFFSDDFFGLHASRSSSPKPGSPRAEAEDALEDIDEMKALIAQIVAPSLAGKTSGSVFRRLARGQAPD